MLLDLFGFRREKPSGAELPDDVGSGQAWVRPEEIPPLDWAAIWGRLPMPQRRSPFGTEGDPQRMPGGAFTGHNGR
jgi:hypothetical protein